MTDTVLSRERKKATLWIAGTWLLTTSMLAFSLYYSLPPGSKWDRAVAIGTCGGLAMVRLEDGSTWLRANSVRVYRIEDPSKLTCG